MAERWKPPIAVWNEHRADLEARAAALLQRIAAAHPSAALATSLQAEDAVLTDLACRSDAAIDLVMLDTGRLHAETSEAKDAIEARYGRQISVFEPNPPALAAWVARNGRDGFYEAPDLRIQCCALRKVEPLARALAGRTAWITGQRRGQSASRGEVPEHEFDAVHGLEKFNPLAAWSLEDFWAYVQRYDVPVNRLYAAGYASIGCEPCTRAIRADEDVRAGRWWWEQSDAKECGLHAAPARETQYA